MDALRSLATALRGLRRSPSFAVAFVLTLGLGIGANTAIFSVVRGVLLKPIPHRGGERLVHVRQTAVVSALPDATWSVPEIEDHRATATTVDGIAEFSALTFTMLGHDEPRRVRAGIVSGNYFDVLGLRPVVGRLLGSGDAGRDADPVMVLTHDFWLRAFGGVSDVVGRSVRVNEKSVAIVGVLEPVPHYPERTDVLVNTVTSPHHMSAAMSDDRRHRMTQVFARIRPGETLQSVTAELDAIAGRLALEYPEAYVQAPPGEPRVRVTPLEDELTHRARPTLLVLLATVAFVLLISCANVTNLTLSRALGRERELSMRAALGAGRARLRGLLLVENAILCLAGAGLGLVVTRAVRDLLVAYAARYTPRAMEIELDGVVLAATLAVASAAALLSGFAPRLPSTTPTGPGRTTSSFGARRLQGALAVGQLALAFVLLLGAGLLTRTLLNLGEVELGYETEDVLTAEVPLSRQGRSPDQILGFYESLRRQVESLPGVEGAALTTTVPLGGPPVLFEVEVEGYQLEPGASMPRADYRPVSPGYFDALGVSLLSGRDFQSSDDARAAKVTIVNASMARFYFGDLDPLGRRLRWSDEQIRFVGIEGDYRMIVGVVPDTMDHGLTGDPVHVVYMPLAQEPWGGNLVVKSRRDPLALGPALLDIVRRLDPEQPVENVRTLEELRAQTLAPQKLNATLVGAFAALSLAVAAVGVFGVLGFSVSRRTKELGIRASVGADRRSLLGLVLEEGLRLQVLGIAIGGLVFFAVARYVRGLLFEVEPYDPGTLVVVASILAAVGTMASFVPAWRASRVEPSEVLRGE